MYCWHDMRQAMESRALTPCMTRGGSHGTTLHASGAIRDVTPSGDGCKECLEMGDSWVHLRLCLTCGYVGCCDDSKNKHATKHATKHARATDHPIIQSFEPGEDWRWCYVDE